MKQSDACTITGIKRQIDCCCPTQSIAVIRNWASWHIVSGDSQLPLETDVAGEDVTEW